MFVRYFTKLLWFFLPCWNTLTSNSRFITRPNQTNFLVHGSKINVFNLKHKPITLIRLHADWDQHKEPTTECKLTKHKSSVEYIHTQSPSIVSTNQHKYVVHRSLQLQPWAQVVVVGMRPSATNSPGTRCACALLWGRGWEEDRGPLTLPSGRQDKASWSWLLAPVKKSSGWVLLGLHSSGCWLMRCAGRVLLGL